MDDILLIQAVERYLAGEMSEQERTFFEELRKSNPEVDQAVVEHTFLLNELERHAATKAYKHSLYEVENKLVEEGVMSKPQLKGKAKIVQFWKKYKRNIAVAACIAGFISLTTAGLIISYNKQVNQANKEDLVAEVKETVTSTIKDNLDSIKKTDKPRNIVPPTTTDYRATGFLVDGKGYLVTNAHVVNMLKTVYVENNKG